MEGPDLGVAKGGKPRFPLRQSDVDAADLRKFIADLPRAVEVASSRPPREEDELKTVMHVDFGSPYGDYAVSLERSPNGRRASVGLVGPPEVAEALMRYLSSGWSEALQEGRKADVGP